MLSPYDDLPVHQIQHPLAVVGTTDRNFYDRYYFNCHKCDGELFMVFGLGVYPNRGVADAFACIRVGSHYQVVRASKELGDDRVQTSVGPFRIEVLEGLKRLRFVLEPNEWGFDADITWEGAGPARLEPRHYREERGRAVMDTSRFNQTGSWAGEINCAGQRYDVDAQHWWGVRDRSWGIRQVGEPEPPGIRGTMRPEGHFWNYAPVRFPDYTLVYMCEEAPDGSRSLEEAVRVPHNGQPETHLGSPRHALEFLSGTREVPAATIHMSEPDGTPVEMRIEALLPIFLGVGTGYGQDEDWRHGMYQGPLVVQGLTYSFDKPEDRTKMVGFVDAVARFTIGDDVGYGLWEYVVAGRNDTYGFKSYMDVAP